jgi:DNA-directed RNA polymerase subunit M/transcription elongation factor TFIIS
MEFCLECNFLMKPQTTRKPPLLFECTRCKNVQPAKTPRISCHAVQQQTVRRYPGDESGAAAAAFGSTPTASDLLSDPTLPRARETCRSMRCIEACCLDDVCIFVRATDGTYYFVCTHCEFQWSA